MRRMIKSASTAGASPSPAVELLNKTQTCSFFGILKSLVKKTVVVLV